jgi:cobalt-zinc-cadmium resistance protein CzcA
MADGTPFDTALREASIGRVRLKLMTCTAILGLLALLVRSGWALQLERRPSGRRSYGRRHLA